MKLPFLDKVVSLSSIAERTPINTVGTTTYALTPVTRVKIFQTPEKSKKWGMKRKKKKKKIEIKDDRGRPRLSGPASRDSPHYPIVTVEANFGQCRILPLGKQVRRWKDKAEYGKAYAFSPPPYTSPSSQYHRPPNANMGDI